MEDLNIKAKKVFSMYSPKIRDYIFKNGWSELRKVQILSGEAVFNTDNNVIISSSTASGKTEAAFFPVLSMIEAYPGNSISVLYIAPTKALINDQFERIENLTDEMNIPVTKWHGDVALSKKTNLIKNPAGILQITPESFESMLINKKSDLMRLFSDLRFVIFDEIHTLMGSDRGNQVKCDIERLSRFLGHFPRIIGLSATMGSVSLAGNWISEGTGHGYTCINIPEEKLNFRIALDHYFIDEGNADGLDAGYNSVYNAVKNKRSIIFSNSREETELVCATMHRICEKKGEEDNFYIHHGNLSAAIREETERAIKEDEKKAVACATVTLELGIDIGQLERIVNIESPNTVSGFLQRMGRSGRRGEPAEMFAVFRETTPLPYAPVQDMIPWHLIQMIAIIQLYIEERFVEPPYKKQMPLSLIFHQTMSILASSGDLSPARLAENVLSLSAFSKVSKEDYKDLLIYWIKAGLIEQTEEKTLIVGINAEKIINNFKFYAVFKDSEDFSVKCKSEEIGTISSSIPVGERFALAGKVWEVTELDIKRRLIYVVRVEGKMEISWPGDSGEIHTRILERMKQVLSESTEYPYLSESSKERIKTARILAKNSGLINEPIINLGGFSYVMLPFLGTKSTRTLKAILKSSYLSAFSISQVSATSCYYISFKMEKGTPGELLSAIKTLIDDKNFDMYYCIANNDVVYHDKYDEYIPKELLAKAYAADKLSLTEIRKKLGVAVNE